MRILGIKQEMDWIWIEAFGIERTMRKQASRQSTRRFYSRARLLLSLYFLCIHIKLQDKYSLGISQDIELFIYFVVIVIAVRIVKHLKRHTHAGRHTLAQKIPFRSAVFLLLLCERVFVCVFVWGAS